MFETLKKIKKGDNVEIMACAGLKSIKFYTTINDVRPDEIIVNAVVRNGKYVSFKNKSIIKNIIVMSQPIPMRFLNVDVLFRSEGKGKVHVIPITAEGIQTNRRDAYRLYLGDQIVASIGENKSLDVELRDISVSGFSVVTKEDLNIELGQDNVRGFYEFEEDRTRVMLNGTIVRKEEKDGNFIYGCKSKRYSPVIEREIAKNQRKKMHI